MKTLVTASLIVLGLSTSAFAQSAPEASAAPTPAAQPTFAAASPVVEQVAAAPASYANCTKSMQDECANAEGASHHRGAHAASHKAGHAEHQMAVRKARHPTRT